MASAAAAAGAMRSAPRSKCIDTERGGTKRRDTTRSGSTGSGAKCSGTMA